MLGFAALSLGVVLLSSCTANFCTSTDKANMAYPYEQGVTVYVDGEDAIPTEYRSQGYYGKLWEDSTESNVYFYVPVNSSGYYAAKKANYLTNTIISSAVKSNYLVPSQAYFAAFVFG